MSAGGELDKALKDLDTRVKKLTAEAPNPIRLAAKLGTVDANADRIKKLEASAKDKLTIIQVAAEVGRQTGGLDKRLTTLANQVKGQLSSHNTMKTSVTNALTTLTKRIEQLEKQAKKR